MDSGLRKLSILAKLRRNTRTTATQIQQALQDEGDNISLRTVQRDLIELAGRFSEVCNDDSKPIGWYINNSSPISLLNLDLTTSITFAMADQHLAGLLPPAMHDRLKPFFLTAKHYLKHTTNNVERLWSKKIAVHGKGMPLHPSTMSEHVINSIYTAVLTEKCVKLTYRSLTTGTTNNFLFHPYGIVVRGERSYLLGKYDGYDDIRTLYFSRIVDAETSIAPAIIDHKFSVNTFIDNGGMGVIRNVSKLEIKLWITETLKLILEETPLAHDQKFEPLDGYFSVTATVDDSDELRHWILSMCNHATVIEPMSLRAEIKATLLDSISYYE